jgi:chain length determinant protein EpsF
MDLNQFILALRARRKAFALVMVAVIVAAVTVSLILPKRYVGTATILADARDEQSMSSARMTARERTGYIATQVDLIKSGRVAARVSRDLKLAQAPGMRDDWQAATGGVGSIDDWIGAGLLEKLKVDTTASSIITITYVSSDARKASEVANGFAKAFMDTAVALRTEPSNEAAQWFDEQLKGLRANLEEAQARLTAYQKQHGIVSTDERHDIEGMRLNDLATQVMRAQEQSRGRTGGAGAPDQLPSVQSNPVVQRLSSDLAAGEAKLAEMSAQYGPNYPAYQRQAEETRAIRQRLNAEMGKVAAATEGQRQAARKREAELRTELAEQHARVLELKQGRNEMGVLMRNLETAQKAYETASQRAVVSQVESRASQTNIAKLDAAAVPTKPARPRLMLNLVLAGIVGVLLGLGIAIALELLDRRVRSAADLAGEWNVPLLGALNAERPAHALLGVREVRALPGPV